MKRRGFLLGVLALVPAFLLTSTATAQNCPLGDDGFANVPCCQPAQANLPRFPNLAISGRYCCFRDCRLEADFPIRVQTVHIPVLCDYAIIPVTVTPGAATSPGWTGVVLAKYARTWLEPDVTGALTRQVWRFLINGDFMPSPNGNLTRPCPIPPHPAAFIQTHFHGHLDYACETDANGRVVFRGALSLHHLPGCIEHNFFSCVPLGGAASHDDRSYHIIAPGEFECDPVQPPTGAPVIAESVRSANFFSAAGYQCFGEARVVQGQYGVVNLNWLCNSASGGPLSFFHYRLDGVAVCGGATTPFRCIPVGPPLPPLMSGCTELPIGRWTLPAGTFPESRELVTHWGILQMDDACNPNDPPFHVVQGISTQRHRGVLFNSNLTSSFFLDLQDMIDPNSLGSGLIRPGWGCIYVSKLVWNLNLP